MTCLGKGLYTPSLLGSEKEVALISLLRQAKIFEKPPLRSSPIISSRFPLLFSFPIKRIETQAHSARNSKRTTFRERIFYFKEISERTSLTGSFFAKSLSPSRPQIKTGRSFILTGTSRVLCRWIAEIVLIDPPMREQGSGPGNSSNYQPKPRGTPTT